MADIKKPQDRKPKASSEDVPEAFSFEKDGETFTLKPTREVLTPGFIRRHRNDAEMDIMFTLVEELADEDALAALDSMSFGDNTETLKKLSEHVNLVMGVDLGK